MLTLFRLVCGPRCRLLDVIIYPALEIFGVCNYATLLRNPSRQNLSGILHVSMNILAIIVKVISRRWVSRNQYALEQHFNITRRSVTVGDMLLGSSFVILFLAMMVPAVRNRAVKNVRSSAISPILYHVTAFRLLRIHFLVTLFFRDLNIHLRSFSTRTHLETSCWTQRTCS